MNIFLKFYYFNDINGYDNYLFSTKKAALDWLRYADKTYLNEGEFTFEEHDMQILYVNKNNKKDILRALRQISIISGSLVRTPEIDYD